MSAGSAWTARSLIAPLLGVVAWSAQGQPVCLSGDSWPTKMRIEYDVTASRGPLFINGESVLQFERAGNFYTLVVTTDSAAIYHARQTSRGNIEPGGLRPEEYVEVRGNRTPQKTVFDWNAKEVRFTTNPDMPSPTSPGLQDRITLLLQLAWRQRSATDTSFEVPVAGARRVYPYHFERHGAEKVKVTIGEIDAVRIERPADEEQDRIEAWFSKTWCDLPVRIRYTDRKGGVIDHRMRAARIE
jgi:hypothetical protein